MAGIPAPSEIKKVCYRFSQHSGNPNLVCNSSGDGLVDLGTTPQPVSVNYYDGNSTRIGEQVIVHSCRGCRYNVGSITAGEMPPWAVAFSEQGKYLGTLVEPYLQIYLPNRKPQ